MMSPLIIIEPPWSSHLPKTEGFGEHILDLNHNIKYGLYNRDTDQSEWRDPRIGAAFWMAPTEIGANSLIVGTEGSGECKDS